MKKEKKAVETVSVPLFNRYGNKTRLVRLDGDRWLFDVGNSYNVQESFDGKFDPKHPELRTILSADPDGGPYMAVGSRPERMTDDGADASPFAGKAVKSITLEKFPDPNDPENEREYYVLLLENVRS